MGLTKHILSVYQDHTLFRHSSFAEVSRLCGNCIMSLLETRLGSCFN